MAGSQPQPTVLEPGGLLALALGISDAVTRGGALAEMVRSCAHELASRLPVHVARIWIRNGDILELAASSGAVTSVDGPASRIRIGESTIGLIAATSESVCTRDLSGFELAGPPIAAFAGFPLRIEDRVIGVIGLFSVSPLRPRVLAVVAPIAATIAQAIERKRVENDLRAALRVHDAVEERLSIITDAAGALLESLEPQPVLRRVVELARKVLAADAYAVWRGEESGEWRILLATGLSAAYQQNIIGHSRFMRDQLPEAPVMAENVDAHPLVEDRRAMYREEGIRSFIAFPLRIQGLRRATLTLYFRTPQKFTDEQVRVGSALANLAAAAITTAEAYEGQRRLGEEAQHRTRRMEFIAEASNLLATTLDYEHTLRAVASLAIPAFADWCAVDVVNASGDIERLATVHADPARVALAEEYHRRFPPRREDPGGVNAVIRNNHPVLVSEIGDEMLLQSLPDAEQIRFLRELRLKSVIITPMAARGKVLGAITFVTAESERRYTPEDLVVAEQVAHRAALAIDNALLYADAEARHAEANRALQALGASHDRLQQFAYAASHDLREPLRTITAYLQLIEKKLTGLLTQDTTEYLAFVTAAAARMQRLLDDLLRYVRLGSGAQNRTTFPLAAAVQRSLENLSLTIAESGAEIVVGDLPLITGDELQFVQLFQNLIANAIKYRGDENPLIRVRSERQDHGWAIAVEDNGVGIAPEHHDRIFGVFRRLHGQNVPGTGIGLAIARAVVENHAGKLWVDSDTGRGATFWFTIPAGSE